MKCLNYKNDENEFVVRDLLNSTITNRQWLLRPNSACVFFLSTVQELGNTKKLMLFDTTKSLIKNHNVLRSNKNVRILFNAIGKYLYSIKMAFNKPFDQQK